MKVFGCILIVLSSAILTMPALSADAANGQVLSRQCSVCHGRYGIAKDPEVPHLAGQSAFYLEKSLKDYQSGARADRRMSLMVQNLSKDDIADLAAWYESIKISIEPPADEKKTDE